MVSHNETNLTLSQTHFIRSLLEGKREISEHEAEIRKKKLGLNALILPCVVVCLSPYYTGVEFEDKDELIRACSNYVSGFLDKQGYRYCCITNAYDNIQIIVPTTANKLQATDLDDIFIRLHQKFRCHFNLDLFIGIGSEENEYAGISRSALEAMEMLAYKHQYADRGVINIVNTSRFKHYSIYGEDIMFARVIGRFQDGNLGEMSTRLDELLDSMRRRVGLSQSSIQRTFIELAINILHIASNADVDVDAVLGELELYTWILHQTDMEVLKGWLLSLSGELLKQMEARQETSEKEIITQACDYISTHLENPELGLKAVSEEVGLSSAYFSQLFKAEKGIGLSNYITETRIARAQQLLHETAMKSEDIALQLGFATPSYFCRVFKKATGITPGSYRKQLKRS